MRAFYRCPRSRLWQRNDHAKVSMPEAVRSVVVRLTLHLKRSGKLWEPKLPKQLAILKQSRSSQGEANIYMDFPISRGDTKYYDGRQPYCDGAHCN